MTPGESDTMRALRGASAGCSADGSVRSHDGLTKANSSATTADHRPRSARRVTEGYISAAMGWWNSFKAALGIATRQSAPAQEVIDPAPMQSMPVIRHAQTDSPTIDLPAELRAQVAEHARSQQQLQAMLGTLANTMHAMPQIATQQAQVLETLLDQSVRARQRDQTIERNLTQLTEGTDRQTQTLGLIQQQLDLNHEVSLRVADSLKDVSDAVGTFASSSERQSRAIESLVQATQRRVAQSDRLERSLQFWLAAVALICTVAMLYGVWSASKGPVVIAIPTAEAPATPAEPTQQPQQ